MTDRWQEMEMSIWKQLKDRYYMCSLCCEAAERGQLLETLLRDLETAAVRRLSYKDAERLRTELDQARAALKQVED